MFVRLHIQLMYFYPSFPYNHEFDIQNLKIAAFFFKLLQVYVILIYSFLLQNT